MISEFYVSKDVLKEAVGLNIYRSHEAEVSCYCLCPDFMLSGTSSDKKPHAQIYALYILDKEQRGRINAVANPTKYFRGVVSLESILCVILL